MQSWPVHRQGVPGWCRHTVSHPSHPACRCRHCLKRNMPSGSPRCWLFLLLLLQTICVLFFFVLVLLLPLLLLPQQPLHELVFLKIRFLWWYWLVDLHDGLEGHTCVGISKVNFKGHNVRHIESYCKSSNRFLLLLDAQICAQGVRLITLKTGS